MEEVKEQIINLNKSLGLKTEFCDCGEGILGYSMKDTIYLNINIFHFNFHPFRICIKSNFMAS